MYFFLDFTPCLGVRHGRSGFQGANFFFFLPHRTLVRAHDVIRRTTAQACCWFGTCCAIMWRRTALVAPSFLLTKLAAMAKFLALKTAKRVRDVGANVVSEVTGVEGGRQGGGLEGKDEETGRTSLTISEGGHAPHA